MRNVCVECGCILWYVNTSMMSLSENMCQECHTNKEENGMASVNMGNVTYFTGKESYEGAQWRLNSDGVDSIYLGIYEEGVDVLSTDTDYEGGLSLTLSEAKKLKEQLSKAIKELEEVL